MLVWKMDVLCHGYVRPSVRLFVSLHFLDFFQHALRYQFEILYMFIQ